MNRYTNSKKLRNGVKDFSRLLTNGIPLTMLSRRNRFYDSKKLNEDKSKNSFLSPLLSPQNLKFQRIGFSFYKEFC